MNAMDAWQRAGFEDRQIREVINAVFNYVEGTDKRTAQLAKVHEEGWKQLARAVETGLKSIADAIRDRR